MTQDIEKMVSAIENGNTEELRQLLQKQENRKALNEYYNEKGETLLLSAVSASSEKKAYPKEIMELLLESGADAKMKNNKTRELPLICAIRLEADQSTATLVAKLIEKGFKLGDTAVKALAEKIDKDTIFDAKFRTKFDKTLDTIYKVSFHELVLNNDISDLNKDRSDRDKLWKAWQGRLMERQPWLGH